MIQPIVLYGDKILRTKAQEVKKGEDVSKIIQDLWDTVEDASGAGLAAPQINISKRIFVVNLPNQHLKQVFINPEILSYSGKEFYFEEGCLSIPNLEGPIKRYAEIKIKYYDENWNEHIMTDNALYSRVIQHEYDHLDGILWIDRLEKKFITKEIIKGL